MAFLRFQRTVATKIEKSSDIAQICDDPYAEKYRIMIRREVLYTSCIAGIAGL